MDNGTNGMDYNYNVTVLLCYSGTQGDGSRGHKGTVLLCYSPKEYSIIILGVMIWRDKLERKARQVFTM